MERVFGTVVGWLIGLGMVLFGLVGFLAINQATPLSSSSYLASLTSTSTPTSTPAVTTTTGKGKSSSTSGKTSTTTGKSASGQTLSNTELVSLGQSVVTAKCEACHVVNGSGGNIGPNLNEVLAGKTLPGMDPGGHPTEAAWLVQWISNPAAVWPSAQMPDLGLSAQQVQAVVAYLTTKVK